MEYAKKFLNGKGEIGDIKGANKYEEECVAKFLKKYGLEQNEKKNVLFLGGDTKGCGYIRAFMPAQKINEYSKKYNAVFATVVTIELAHWADIIIWQRQYKEVFLNFLLTAKDVGKVQIYELDDNFHEIPPSNPVYFELNPGEKKFYESLKWMSICDKMLVSNPELKEYYDTNVKVNCDIIGNCIDAEKVEKIDKLDNRIRIVWAGGHTHLKDLLIIKSAIKRIKKEYGKKVKFTMIGCNGVADFPIKKEKFIDKDGTEKERTICQHVDISIKHDKFVRWIDPVDAYVTKLNAMHFDIGLCPLEHTKFNKYKSNIKWLEYSLCGMATIASDYGPYQCIENDVDGCKIANNEESWYNAIKTLIDNKGIRTKLAENANKRVIENYDINKNWVKYEELFDKLLKEKTIERNKL